MILTWWLSWFVLIVVGLGDAVSTPDSGPRQLCDANRTLPMAPAIVHVVSDRGEYQKQIVAHEYGLLTWTAGRERLVFLGPSDCGMTLNAFDPTSGNVSILAAPEPFWNYRLGVGSRLLEVEQRTGSRDVLLPGPRADDQEQLIPTTGLIRLSDGDVLVNDRVVARDRGQSFWQLTSPSGKWPAIIARHEKNARVLYRVEPDALEIAWIRLINRGERIISRAAARSPDGRWQVSLSDGRIVPADDNAAGRMAVWSVDSRRAAVLTERGLYVVRRGGDPRLVVTGCCSMALIEWDGDWILHTVGRFGEDDE